MATAGAYLVLAVWVQLYFSFLSILQQPPEQQTKRECYRGKPASLEGRREQVYVHASARRTGRGGQRDVHTSTEDNGSFSPFRKLRYRFFGWSPVDRIVAGINMDIVYLLAGDPQADLPRMIQVNLNDIMILFLRWLKDRDLTWPLQREVTKAALFREHYRYARQFLQEVTAAENNPQEAASKAALSVQAYRQLSAAEARLRNWFFDGNTFIRRDGEDTRSDQLSDDDVGFMRGLPLNVLRIARGVFAQEMPAPVARLAEELKIRNITTTNQLLEKSNFIDLFALLDVFDEALTQVDVLREFHRNWVNEGVAGLRQQTLPGVQWTGPRNLTALATSPKASVAEFPKCSTLKCYMSVKWNNTPTRFITVEKNNVNSLKLLLIGNSGDASPLNTQGNTWKERLKKIFGFDELQQTVDALKDWHTREKADAVLGLGNILGIPSAASVRSDRFDTKWYNPFVKGAGLDVPWIMTTGSHEGLLSPATPIRYHYTLQQPNWHMPNDMYSVVFQFRADLRLENGGIERDAFNVTLVNLNTWALLAGNPITNNLQMQLNRMTWISRQLFAAAKRNSTWVIVMGHHPIISTGAEGKQARLQYLDDVYSSGHFRGWEYFVMQHLFFHYQIDAYISGLDYLMEYNTVEDLDKNTTISFINSGATARLMDRTIGRGWIGRLRGALHPILCFTGQRLFFLADPGGCAPSDAEKGNSLGWFAPKYGNYKVNIVERAMRATGFTSLQLTKEFMVVEFIDARTKKPATRSVQRRSNKAARDISFADPAELGRKKYAELRQNREEFVRANIDLLRKEIYVAKHCPILAERVDTYVREINSMADRYEKIRLEDEAFQKMTETEIDAAAAVGVDWEDEVQRVNAEMRAVAKYHRSLKAKHADLLDFKDTLPRRDDPRYTELLHHEKAMIALQRKRLDLVRQYGEDTSLASAGKFAVIDKKLNTLAAMIGDLEKSIKTSPPPESESETTEQEPQQATETPRELIIDKLTNTEKRLRRLEEALRGIKHADTRASVERATKVQEQLEKKLKDIRAQLAALSESLDPVTAWQKQQELHTTEAKVKYMRDYLTRAEKHSQLGSDSAGGDSRAITSIRTELKELEDQAQKLKNMLGFRQVTPLQRQYLEKKAALALAELLQTQGDYLSEEEKVLERVNHSLHLAAEAERHLREEVQQLEQQVNEELEQAVTEWKQREGFLRKSQKEEGTVEQNKQEGNGGLNRSDELTESTLAVSVGPPSTTTNAEKRRLSEMESAKATERLVDPLGKQHSGVWETVSEKVRNNDPQHRVNVRSTTHTSRARQLSVHQPVEDSAEREGTSEIDSSENKEGTQTPSEKTSEQEHPLRTPSENHGETAGGQSAEVETQTEPVDPTSNTAATPLPHSGGTEVLEKANDASTDGAGEEAENAEVDGRKSEARTPVKERGKGDTDEGKKPERKGGPRKKGDPNAKIKELEDGKKPRVSEVSEPENEELQDRLDKIYLGPLDECQLIPLLDVMVRRALHPEENEEKDRKCEKTLADRALARQLKTLTVNQLLSKGSQGMGAGVHSVPSVHVSRGWRLYFDDSQKIMFKALMRDLKAGLLFVEETFKRSEGEKAVLQRLHEKRVQAEKQTKTSQSAAVRPPDSKTENAVTADSKENLLSEQSEGQRPASESSSTSDKPHAAPVTAAVQHSESTAALNPASKSGETARESTE